MARFKDIHLTPYLIGEGLSGFLPIVVAMIQGSQEEQTPHPCNISVTDVDELPPTDLDLENIPEDITDDVGQPVREVLFGPSWFFLSLLVTLVISWAAFFWLLYSQTAKKEMVSMSPASESIRMTTMSQGNKGSTNLSPVVVPSSSGDCNNNGCNRTPTQSNVNLLFIPTPPAVRRDSIKTYPYHLKPEIVLASRQASSSLVAIDVSNTEYYWLQGIIVFACLSTFGIFPSLQPYSCLPYGYWCMHYTVITTGLAYPVGAALALWKDASNLIYILFWTGLGSIISVYILSCAIMSPNPFLSNKSVILGVESDILGGTIMVSAWILYIGILSYVKTVVTVKLARARGEDALFLVGLFTQVGSVFGAAFMFVAVNIFRWFRDSSC